MHGSAPWGKSCEVMMAASGLPTVITSLTEAAIAACTVAACSWKLRGSWCTIAGVPHVALLLLLLCRLLLAVQVGWWRAASSRAITRVSALRGVGLGV